VKKYRRIERPVSASKRRFSQMSALSPTQRRNYEQVVSSTDQAAGSGVAEPTRA